MIAPIVIKCKLFTTLCYLYACKCVYPFQHRASDGEEAPQEENGIIIVQTCTCPTCVSDFYVCMFTVLMKKLKLNHIKI